MKSKIYLICLLTLLLSCDNEQENLVIEGKLLSHTACKIETPAVKTAAIPRNKTCIDYTFNSKTNTLSLKHINAGFNCCPGVITIQATLNGETLVIRENSTGSECACNCLYDLEMEITGVASRIYQIQFDECLLGTTDPISFQIDLSKQSSGRFLKTRNKYPWGLHE